MRRDAETQRELRKKLLFKIERTDSTRYKYGSIKKKLDHMKIGLMFGWREF